MSVARGIALTALVLAVGLACYLLLFKPAGGHEYTLLFQNAGQLVKDDDVQVGGRRIGSVRSIQLTDNLSYPVYRLAICGFCLVVAALIFFVITRTKIGMIVRAGAENREMTRVLGIKFDVVNRYVFAVGIALAALGGIVIAPISTVFPGMGDGMLILSFVVVVLGGIGSVAGAAVGALFIGLTDTFGKVFFPSVSSILIYVLMAAVLLWRPNGILGRREV